MTDDDVVLTVVVVDLGVVFVEVLVAIELLAVDDLIVVVRLLPLVEVETLVDAGRMVDAEALSVDNLADTAPQPRLKTDKTTATHSRNDNKRFNSNHLRLFFWACRAFRMTNIGL